MYIIGVLAFSEDVLGDVAEIRITLEHLGYTVHLEQIGYDSGFKNIGMFEDDSLLLLLGRCYNDIERCAEIAEDFINESVDLILAMKSPAVHTALAATNNTRIPVVFTNISDPVVEGIIVGPRQQDGQMTGVRDSWPTTMEKRLALLQQVVPSPIVIHAFYNPDSPVSLAEAESLEKTAGEIGVELNLLPVRESEDAKRVISSMQIFQNHAILRTSDSVLDSVSGLIGVTARENNVPYIGIHLEEMERCGALFIVDQRGVGSQAAVLVHRILKGEDPACIPVVEPERIILGVNLQAAQDLGLVVADSVLQDAQVIIHEKERTSLGTRLFFVLFIVAFSIILAVAIAAQSGLRMLIITGIVAIVFDALSLWVYINYRIIHPIRKLTLVAEKIGVGNLDVNIGDARIEDEIGVLGRTLRRMRSNIRYSQTQLERLNANLEQQIIQRNVAIRELQEIQEELKLANKRIIDADDNSRFSLTSYIHDEILLPLDRLNAHAKASGDSEVSDLTSQISRHLRKVRFDLSMPIIYDMHVELNLLIQETLPQLYPIARQIKLSLDLNALNQIQDFGPACSVLLYRFVRGALSNIYRHANAQHIWIKSTYDSGRLGLLVLDDGIGFDPDKIEQFIGQGHYFFHDIYIRAQQLGGELTIQSEPQKGSKLSITIPIPQENSQSRVRKANRPIVKVYKSRHR